MNTTRHAFTLLTTLLLAPLAAAPSSKAKPAPNPSLAPVDDVAGLRRVLLIGDSVSIGYTLPTRELLKGKANVHRPSTNCSSTGHGLSYMLLHYPGCCLQSCPCQPRRPAVSMVLRSS
jgi:acyl-CoA thioesterase-1